MITLVLESLLFILAFGMLANAIIEQDIISAIVGVGCAILCLTKKREF